MFSISQGRFVLRVNALQELNEEVSWVLRSHLEQTPGLAGLPGWLRPVVDRFRFSEFYGVQFGAPNTVGIMLLDKQKDGWHLSAIDFNPVKKQGLYSAVIERLSDLVATGTTIHIDDIAEPETLNTLYHHGDFFTTPLGKPFAGRRTVAEVVWDIFGPSSITLQKTEKITDLPSFVN